METSKSLKSHLGRSRETRDGNTKVGHNEQAVRMPRGWNLGCEDEKWLEFGLGG
jgi:hypothetical protein